MTDIYMYYCDHDSTHSYSGSRSLMVGKDSYNMKYFWVPDKIMTYPSSDPLALWDKLTKLKRRL